MKRLFTVLLLLASMGAATTAWAKNRSGSVLMDFDLGKQSAGQEVRLWIPYPVSDRDQQVNSIKFTGDYAEAAVYTDRAHKNPLLYARWPKEAASRKLTLSFQVDRQEVTRRDFPATEGAWNRADFAEYLRPTSLGPIDGEVKKLADRITQGIPTVLGKARAIYDWTCENTYRDPNTRGCGTGDVCQLLNRPGGKCTDISSVFIALCRAAGVPAREIFGLRLGKKANEEITGYQHCWAEFYLPGYGWVPADPADVRKAMLVEQLDRTSPKTREYHDYFWGGIDPYRVALATGRDIVLTPLQAGAPLNTFGYPYAEAGGTVVDWLDPGKFTYKFTFTER